MRFFPLLLIPTFILLSCSGETVDPYDAGDVSDHYLPLSTGSTWTFSGYRSGLAIEGDTIIDGRAWVVRRSPGEEPTYLRREGDTYYQRTPDGEEIILLRERGMNTTWRHFVEDESRNIRERLDYHVVSLDGRRVVNGSVYEDLMHVHVTSRSEKEGGDWDRTGTVVRYYARGVGLVEEITLDADGVLEARLTAFDVVGSSVEVRAAEENEVDGGRVAVTVDSLPWDVRRVSVNAERNEIYIASGYGVNGDALRITLESLVPGVHQLGVGDNNASYTWDVGAKITGGPSGEVEITTNSREDVSGRFSMVMENGTAIEGTFVVDR